VNIVAEIIETMEIEVKLCDCEVKLKLGLLC